MKNSIAAEFAVDLINGGIELILSSIPPGLEQILLDIRRIDQPEQNDSGFFVPPPRLVDARQERREFPQEISGRRKRLRKCHRFAVKATFLLNRPFLLYYLYFECKVNSFF